MKSGIMIDTKLKRFAELSRWENDTYSVLLKDIDETFWFDNKIEVQEFLNLQAVERFYEKELRKGFFEAKNDHGETFIYKILEMKNGKIIKFTSEIGI